MACCNEQRASMRRESGLSGQSGLSRQSVVQQPASGPTQFEYKGAGQLTVTGPLTGTIYRFGGPGARVLVHAADAPSLVSVAGLRPVL